MENPLVGARVTFLENAERTNGESLRVEVVLPPGLPLEDRVLRRLGHPPSRGADTTGNDRLAGTPRAYDAATRHSCACISLLERVNPKSVALQMGWSSVAFMLQNYARFLPGWGDGGAMDAALS